MTSKFIDSEEEIKFVKDSSEIIYGVIFLSLIPIIIIAGETDTLTDFIKYSGGVFFIAAGFLFLLFNSDGVIILNKKKKQIEFKKGIGFDHKEGIFPVDDINSIYLRKMVWHQYMTEKQKLMRTFYVIGLNLNKVDSSVQKEIELDLRFTHFESPNDVAEIIGRFCKKPVYDCDGNKIFEPQQDLPFN